MYLFYVSIYLLSPQLLERTTTGFEESDCAAPKSPLHLAVSELPWAAVPVCLTKNKPQTLVCS